MNDVFFFIPSNKWRLLPSLHAALLCIKPLSPSSSDDSYPNPSPSIHPPFPLYPSSMQRHRQNPKTPKKNPAVKHKPKSKTQPPIIINPNPASDDDDDRSSVCSNSTRHRRLAAEEEELRIREELEDEIERELEQELIDGISVLVRRLTELKARQIARGFGIVSCGGGFSMKTENEIGGATRRWVAASFSQKEGVVGFGGDSGCSSGCSDAESTTRIVLRTTGDRR